MKATQNLIPKIAIGALFAIPTFLFLYRMGPEIEGFPVAAIPTAIWGLMIFFLPDTSRLLKVVTVVSVSVVSMTLFLASRSPGEQEYWGLIWTSMLKKGVPASYVCTGALAFVLLLEKPRNKPKSSYFLLLGALAFLSYASSSKGGSGWQVRYLVEHFGFSEATAEETVHWIRKCLHFSFYGTVALLAKHVAKGYGLRAAQAVVWAFALTLMYASFDEARQVLAPGRTGRIQDVVLDLAGASTFLFIAAQRRRLTKRA